MKRINIKTSLIFWDIITFIVVFISTYLMFEVVIKNIISNSSNTDFYETIDSVELEYFTALDYLENKDTLIYKDYVEDIIDYSVKSGTNRVKYDDSVFMISTTITDLSLLYGKKNDPEYVIAPPIISRETLEIMASHIPEKLLYDKYKILESNVKNNIQKEFLKTMFKKSNDGNYIRIGKPNITDRDIFYTLTHSGEYIADETISFDFELNGKAYIGIAEYAKHGIYLDEKKENITYPIFIVTDLRSDFYYLINKVRNTFLAILLFVFLLVVIIKLITTTKITREIASISKIISQEGEHIRISGLVNKNIKSIGTDFLETSKLYDSYANLHNRLNILGDIVSGISDKELLSAVLMETASVLEPHEEYMSVLFLDIKGFTTLTEKYQEKVFTIVNSIWFEVEKIVEKNYGKINKYIGDACLIIFQDDKGKQNSSFYALKSGILILEKVKQLQEELEIDFNFRVGIDYGKLVYGKTGTENNYELGVIGDAVNTSARLEAINKQYKTNILMTETVKNRIDDDLKQLNPHLSFYKVDKVRPKGKKVPKELYTILGNNGLQSRFLGANKYVSNKSLSNIQKIMNSFTKGISLWEDSNKKSIARKKWIETLNLIKKAYKEEPLPTMEKYISRIVTVTEYEEYKTNRELWFTKTVHEIKEPSDDWIKYGYIEIEK